ncbi:hypothetical protein KFU94_04915 [Chloroflexi bacterium TSY]|nr:hypothetical protein [Chloroflexi bacterium TSY]
MNKFLILGCQGSGKTYLAKQLGTRLDIPVFHLDEVFWESWGPPLNVTPTAAQIEEKLIELTSGQAWIIDGNFIKTLPMRLARCDVVVYLAAPRWLCIWRVIRRYLVCRLQGVVRPHEQIHWQLLKHIWRFPQTLQPKLLNLIDENEPHGGIWMIKSSRELWGYLNQS